MFGALLKIRTAVLVGILLYRESEIKTKTVKQSCG